MWFFRSFSYLPRPTFQGLAPWLAIFIVFWLFQDEAPTVRRYQLSPLGLAVFSGLALLHARNFPSVIRRSKEKGLGYLPVLPIVPITVLAGWGVFAGQDISIQIGWAIGYTGFAALVAVAVFSSGPDELADLPFRWASDHPLAQSAMRLTVVRLALEAAGATTIMIYGSVEDWVLFVSLGRLALWHFFDWIIILTVMTAPDEDS